jgi:hypothetical protein
MDTSLAMDISHQEQLQIPVPGLHEKEFWRPALFAYGIQHSIYPEDIRSFTLKSQSIESFNPTRSAGSDASAIILASMRGYPDAPSRSSFSQTTASSR